MKMIQMKTEITEINSFYLPLLTVEIKEEPHKWVSAEAPKGHGRDPKRRQTATLH